MSGGMQIDVYVPRCCLGWRNKLREEVLVRNLCQVIVHDINRFQWSTVLIARAGRDLARSATESTGTRVLHLVSENEAGEVDARILQRMPELKEGVADVFLEQLERFRPEIGLQPVPAAEAEHHPEELMPGIAG